MRLKLICCDVFARIAYKAAAVTAHRVDLELLPMLAHNEPDKLRANLQAAIDKAALCPEGYDKILLAYGLCGNAVADISSPIPLIIPRMHDCCAMFLGSQAAFKQHFGQRLSCRWRSCGYMERCSGDILGDYKLDPEYLRLVAQYGEDNAEYIWQSMSAPIETDSVVYIEIPGYEYNDTKVKYIEEMAAEGKEVEVISGNPAWFEALVNGPWPEEDFLHLLPSCKILPIYDMDEIFKSSK